MAAVRTYGIPRIIEAHEIFYFNNGKGKLPIRFTGGITDPKYNIPATYSTNSDFEQLVIERSPQFGRRVFRYDAKGNIISKTPTDPVSEITMERPKSARTVGVVDDSKVYERVETIAEATEVLLDNGAKAAEVTTPEDVLAAMVRLKISFPNLKLK